MVWYQVVNPGVSQDDLFTSFFKPTNPFVPFSEFVQAREPGQDPWGASQPAIDIDKLCVAIDSEGELFNANCGEKKPFACRIPQICEEGLDTLTCDGESIIGSATFLNLPFEIAVEACEDFSDRVGLFVLTSEKDFDVFTRLVENFNEPPSGLWTGLIALNGSFSDPTSFIAADG